MKIVKTISISMYVLSSFTILLLVILRFLISEKIPLNWDAQFLIDGAYRVFLNQKPHVDFSTPLGPIVFLVGAIGMIITTPTIAGVNVGFILFGIFVLIVGYLALRQILKPQLMAVFLVLLASMVFTPRILSYPTGNYGYTGIYNAYGYSILCVLALLLFTDLRSDVNSRNINLKHSYYRGVWAAGLLVLLFFLKVTYGLAAIFLITVWFFHEKNKKRFFLGATLGGGGYVTLTCMVRLQCDINYQGPKVCSSLANGS